MAWSGGGGRGGGWPFISFTLFHLFLVFLASFPFVYFVCIYLFCFLHCSIHLFLALRTTRLRKTCLLIGINSSRLSSLPLRDADEPAMTEKYFIPAKGTLIIVPSNLLDQWLTEIGKFMHGEQPLRKQMIRGWSPPSCPAVGLCHGFRQSRAVEAVPRWGQLGAKGCEAAPPRHSLGAAGEEISLVF